jgi:type II secretory pathway pseudopilin PulG
MTTMRPSFDSVCSRAEFVDRLGLTLVELLVTLTVSGIVMGSMVSYFVVQTKSSRLAEVRIEAVQRARFASELLRREVGLAGAGIPNAQPLVVYAGPDDFVFSSDLASSTPGDRVAVYQLPGAAAAETEGADSGSVALPNAEAYPKLWYGPDGTPGPAETVRFSFVSLGDGGFALIRSVNAQRADTLLRDLQRIDGRQFFSYRVMDAEGRLRDLLATPIWHAAELHESAADTAGSALSDSIKLVEIAFKVTVQGRRPEESVERSFSMGVALKNAGLVRNAACGAPPTLGVTPTAQQTGIDPPAVTISWPPAVDETAGEMDVRQYTLYRRESSETVPRPIASIPPGTIGPAYTYVDSDVETGKTYVYLLGATDCTPAQSGLAGSESVTVSGA